MNVDSRIQTTKERAERRILKIPNQAVSIDKPVDLQHTTITEKVGLMNQEVERHLTTDHHPMNGVTSRTILMLKYRHRQVDDV